MCIRDSEAAVLFRNMKQYENVDLINSKAIADSEPDCLEGSLYLSLIHICEQLDSYRQIKDKIEDLRKRIEILTDIQTSGQELVRLQSDKILSLIHI